MGCQAVTEHPVIATDVLSVFFFCFFCIIMIMRDLVYCILEIYVVLYIISLCSTLFSK